MGRRDRARTKAKGADGGPRVRDRPSRRPPSSRAERLVGQGDGLGYSRSRMALEVPSTTADDATVRKARGAESLHTSPAASIALMPAPEAVESPTNARLALVESLLASGDLHVSARQCLDWLARHAGSARHLLASSILTVRTSDCGRTGHRARRPSRHLAQHAERAIADRPTGRIDSTARARARDGAGRADLLRAGVRRVPAARGYRVPRDSVAVRRRGAGVRNPARRIVHRRDRSGCRVADAATLEAGREAVSRARAPRSPRSSATAPTSRTYAPRSGRATGRSGRCSSSGRCRKRSSPTSPTSSEPRSTRSSATPTCCCTASPAR